ncbi:MAG: circularly permuted type 2 ATP-grasp protein [Pirellulaceae bacterium]
MTAQPPAETTPDRQSLFASYRPVPGHYDEMFSADGQVRPHWAEFARRFEALGPGDIKRRLEQAQRLIRENGVTYNAYGEAESTRPWHLDAVPLLLEAAEWRSAMQALKQRALLLDHILADLSGPQQLLRDKILPAELLFTHPGYYRSYIDMPVPGKRRLHFYAADLARSPDGAWWVIGDRTRAPSGMGYALENRIATSRMLPSTFRACRVERLASYFITLRETLKELAPQSRENPRIVLWTEGPSSPHYFEDAYLARYLNYTLAESGDLAVRNNQVMLKTLGALLPIQVLFRRLDDDVCDPVELRGSSKAGLAGLLQVIRSGNVVAANPLGSRLVESPAFMGFLPAICEHVLGEPLAMPSVATWWCGQPYALKHVLERLDDLLIRPAFRTGDVPPVNPTSLSRRARESLVASIKARPGDYVAQEHIARSTVPVWTDAGPTPWHVAMRAFLVANEESYAALPGGLVRVSPNPEVLDWSMTAGERSQDCWILADGPIDQKSLLDPEGQPVPLRRSGSELPSRVADNLFWLGRAVERAEGAARLLRSVLARLTSEANIETLHELPVLLRCLAEQGQIEPGFVVEGLQQHLPAIEKALPAAVFNDQESRSLRATVNEMLRLASIVRDRISIDAWRIINQISQRSTPPRFFHGDLEASDVLAVLNHVIVDLASFAGMVAESMTRTQGWRFLEIGRRIERVMHTSALLQTTLVERREQEGPILDAVLEVADSTMTYRARYLANLQVAPVLDLLVSDELNPRSLAYQLARLAEHVDQLPRDQSIAVRGQEERVALSTLNAVRLADVQDLSAAQSDDVRRQLERLLTRLSDQMPKLSDAISNRYLIHAGVARQFQSYVMEHES